MRHYFTYPNGRSSISHTGLQYNLLVATEARRLNLPRAAGLVKLHIKFHVPQETGNILGRANVVGISLEGLAYYREEQIAGATIERQVDGQNPRVEVEIHCSE